MTGFIWDPLHHLHQRLEEDKGHCEFWIEEAEVLHVGHRPDGSFERDAGALLEKQGLV